MQFGISCVLLALRAVVQLLEKVVLYRRAKCRNVNCFLCVCVGFINYRVRSVH